MELYPQLLECQNLHPQFPANPCLPLCYWFWNVLGYKWQGSSYNFNILKVQTWQTRNVFLWWCQLFFFQQGCLFVAPWIHACNWSWMMIGTSLRFTWWCNDIQHYIVKFKIRLLFDRFCCMVPVGFGPFEWKIQSSFLEKGGAEIGWHVTCCKSFYFMVMVMFHPAMLDLQADSSWKTGTPVTLKVRLSPFQVQHGPDHIDSNASKKECTPPWQWKINHLKMYFLWKWGFSIVMLVFVGVIP